MPQTTLTTKSKANCSGSTPKEMARGAKMGAKMRTFAVHSIKHPKNSSTTLISSKMTILLLVKLVNASLIMVGSCAMAIR